MMSDKQTMRPPPRLFHLPRAVITAHVDAGLTDSDIARFYGVKTPSVWFYRQKHQIPCNRDVRLYKIPREVIEWLVSRGLSDAEIGRIFKVSSEAVCAFRFKKCIVSSRPSPQGWAK